MAKLKFKFIEVENGIEITVSHTKDVLLKVEEDLKRMFDIEMLSAEIFEKNGMRIVSFITENTEMAHSLMTTVSQTFRKSCGLDEINLN